MNSKNNLQDESFFKDIKGNIVLWQWPNIPLYGWIAFKVLSMLVPAGHLRVGMEQLSSAFLFTWAYLEITNGVNYFRRLLGVIVMGGLIISFLR
ncbi:hypothetical protein IPL85_00190 [Candidatus Saccharibacteria bacterium]|nr:MAG: hypothetical protein IPL85_00190 [Candidatus Saccharibacteria bacterium]